jgi:hypothetical protein
MNIRDIVIKNDTTNSAEIGNGNEVKNNDEIKVSNKTERSDEIKVDADYVVENGDDVKSRDNNSNTNLICFI